VGNIKYCG